MMRTPSMEIIGKDENGNNLCVCHFECDSAADLPTYNVYQSDGYVFAMSCTAHTIADNKMYELNGSGVWVDITPNSGAYTLPPATANSLGGIIVGSGLSIDGAGVLSASGGGASMPYTNHNGGIRGNNLGSSYTAAQQSAIASGDFTDIYVGDYWEISGTKYYIVDIDYYLGYGNPTPTTEHHVIVFPDDVLSAQGYAYDASYYGSSSIYSTYLPAIASDLVNDFGNYLINQKLVLYQSGGNAFWGQAKCILPSMIQLQGYSQTVTPDKLQHKANQFSFFRYNNALVRASQRYWLRDSSGDGNTSFETPEGSIGFRGNSELYYLRPYFILSGTAQ